jgi:hypothetical protein
VCGFIGRFICFGGLILKVEAAHFLECQYVHTVLLGVIFQELIILNEMRSAALHSNRISGHTKSCLMSFDILVCMHVKVLCVYAAFTYHISCIQGAMLAQSVQQLDYSPDDPQFLAGTRDFSLSSKYSDQFGAHPASNSMGNWGFCHLAYSGRGMNLTTCSHLVPRFRINGAITQHPFCTFMMQTGTTFN